MRRFVTIMTVVAGVFTAGRASGQQIQERGTGTITGVVLAEGSGTPLSAAAVTIRRSADSVAVGTIPSGSDGEFARAGLPVGTYIVEFEALGYAPVIRRDVRISEDQRVANLGSVALRQEAIVLDGIEAVGERSPVVLASDRTIYHVTDMPVVEGGYATDALRVIPELEVDIDDNVRARGGEPQIYLDGRPIPMQGSARTEFLRSLRADRIDRIEYIPNPSARFEADGQSGIVNIVLRRDTSLGTSGSASVNAGTRGTQGVSTRLNHQSGPLTFFGGGSLNFSQSNSATSEERANLGALPITFLEQSSDRTNDGISGSGDVTVEWRTTERSTLWGIVRGNVGDSEGDEFSRFIRLDQDHAILDRYEREHNTESGNDGFSGALGYRRVVSTQRDEFSAEIRYSGYGSDSDSRNLHFEQSADGVRLGGEPGLTRLDTSSKESLWSAQADLSKPLGEATRLDIGYRANFRVNDNLQEGELYTPLAPSSIFFDDQFRYSEDSHAAYITLDHRFHSLALQVGMRTERVHGTVNANNLDASVHIEHTGYFPSASVAYDPGNGRQLRFSYSNRIQRPSAGNLNPINSTPADPYNITVGNPMLGTADVHMIESSAAWTGSLGTLRIAPYIFTGTDLWDRVRSVDSEGISTVTPKNVASAQVEGMNLSFSMRERGRFSGNAGFSIQHLSYDVGDLTEVRSDELTSWNLNATVMTSLTPTLRLQTMGRYSPGELMPYGRTAATKQVNLALTQRIYGDRGTINLSIVDPFDLSRQTITSQNADYRQTGRTSNRVRRATLSISYNFGQAPQSNRRVVADESSSGGGMSGP